MADNDTVLYEFREGANGGRVDDITTDTRLGKECEFEGLAFDPAINSLLLACKNVEQKKRRDSMIIYRWRLDGGGERYELDGLGNVRATERDVFGDLPEIENPNWRRFENSLVDGHIYAIDEVWNQPSPPAELARGIRAPGSTPWTRATGRAW